MMHFLELKSIGPSGSKLHRCLKYRSETMQFTGDENSRKYCEFESAGKKDSRMNDGTMDGRESHKCTHCHINRMPCHDISYPMIYISYGVGYGELTILI